MPISRLRITVKIDDAQFRAALKELEPNQVKASAVIAINQTAKQVQGFSASLLAKELGLKVGDVRKRVAVHKASKGRLLAVISPSMRALPLYGFKARQIKRGVSATAWGRRKLYQGTFIATMPTGHIGVFKRIGLDRLPIKELMEPSIGYTFGREPIRSQIEAEIALRLPINLARQLQRRIAVASGKVSLSGQSRQRFERAAA